MGCRLWALGLLGILLCAVPSAEAQRRPLALEVAVDGLGATEGTLPFWLHANRFGTVDPRGGNARTRLSATRPLSPGRMFDYAVGVEVLARASDRSTAFLHQLYGHAKLGPFHLTGGRREQDAGLLDPNLSIGSWLISPNASPIPKVSIGSDYLAMPNTDGALAITGFVAHGWLEEGRFVENALLHEKYVFLRFFPDRWPARFYVGVLHNVTWGGTHPRLGDLPQGFEDYLDVFFGRAGEAGDAPQGEVLNSLGNTVAAYAGHLHITYPTWTLRLYHQHYIETGPAARFRNPYDGLWGGVLKWTDRPRLVNGLLYEYIHSLRQGSKYSEGEPRGADNYYNNFIYRSGWTYHGRSLGVPLLFSDGDHDGVVNNLLVGHHVGLEGVIAPRLHYKTLLTYSRNYGARDGCGGGGCSENPMLLTPRRDQLSFLFEMHGPLLPRYQLYFNAALGADVGEVHPDNVGVMVGLVWRNDGAR